MDTVSAARSYIGRLRELGFEGRADYSRVAFSRNRGLLSESEQEQLAGAVVAVPGVGGVGGVHLETLARLGVGAFHIADFDTFEAGNVNRQVGARVPNFGRPKLDAMAESVLGINPFAEIHRFPDGVSAGNIDGFLDGVDVVVDSLDFFAFDTRRMVFNRAREKGIWVVSAGPIGFSTALLVFAPDRGLSFDEYFNVTDDTEELDKLAAFLVGLTPHTKYLSYMELSRANRSTGRGPSLGLACQLCAGVATTEVVRILLDRKPPLAAPHYSQFDPYLRRYFKGRLRGGNRHPWQRIKRRMVRRMLAAAEVTSQARQQPPTVPGDSETVTPEIVDYVVRAGIQAPSGDNGQPWKFDRNGSMVGVYLDRDVDRSFFNVDQYASLISCGAVVENMRVAASACGFDAEIICLPEPDERGLVATLSLARSDRRPDPLHEAIWERHTNRTMYRRQPLMDAVVSCLEQSVEEFEGARVHVLRKPDELRRLARVVRRADSLRVTHRGLHEHFHSMIRRTDAEAQATMDGLPLQNLEAGASGEKVILLTRNWRVMNALNRLGFDRFLATVAARGLAHCAGAALLTVPGTSPLDFVRGGRALERAWLTLTNLEISMQPMTAITLFWLRVQLEGDRAYSPSHRRLLEPLWRDYRELFADVDFERDGQVMLFRFGHGRPMSVRTLRKPPEALLVDTDQVEQRVDGREQRATV